MPAVFHRIKEALLEVLYPRHCVHTGRPMRDGDPYRYLSAEGAKALAWIEEPLPERRFAPFEGDFLVRSLFLQMVENPRNFRSAMSLFALRGAGRSFVHELKYRNGLYLQQDIAQLVADCPTAQTFLNDAVLVPVPLHASRERERGFNQSQVIVSALGTRFGIAQANLLRRVVPTRTQTRLSREQRERNVQGAFCLCALATPQGRLDPQRRYVLVDDVYTTGATLNEAASVLRDAGAGQVDVFTLGHG